MSEVTKGSGLSVVINNKGHISFNADTSFSIEEQESPFAVHLADVITSVVLEAIKNQVKGALLFPGDFRLLLTGCISDVTNVNEEKENAAANVEEVNEEESSSEEAVEEAQETSEEEESNQEARTEPERTDED